MPSINCTVSVLVGGSQWHTGDLVVNRFTIHHSFREDHRFIIETAGAVYHKLAKWGGGDEKLMKTEHK